MSGNKYNAKYDDNKIPNTIYVGKKMSWNGRYVDLITEDQQRFFVVSEKENATLYKTDGGKQKIQASVVEADNGAQVRVIYVSRINVKTGKVACNGEQQMCLYPEVAEKLYNFIGKVKSIDYSNVGLDGSNTVITDYLLGDKMFTTFVELKKPSTKLFAKIQNRSNSWRLSSDVVHSVSQILEQKASGLIKLDKPGYDSDGNIITQKAYNSKVILIIGHWKELKESSNDLECEIKKKTLELFRTDSRNIELLTYDELYDRAKYIVEGKNKEIKPNITVDDIPF